MLIAFPLMSTNNCSWFFVYSWSPIMASWRCTVKDVCIMVIALKGEQIITRQLVLFWFGNEWVCVYELAGTMYCLIDIPGLSRSISLWHIPSAYHSSLDWAKEVVFYACQRPVVYEKEGQLSLFGGVSVSRFASLAPYMEVAWLWCAWSPVHALSVLLLCLAQSFK